MKLFILLLLSTMSMAGLPKHYVSTTNVSVGDTFTYTVALPPNAILPQIPTLNGLEIKSNHEIKTTTANIYKFELQLFSIETPMIPTLSLRNINGIPPIELSAIYLNLVSLLTPSVNEYNDIAPIIRLFHINWGLIAASLIVIILGFLIWKKKAFKNQIALNAPPPAPPIEIAMKKLEALIKELTNDEHQIKQSYFRLTEIFCTFLTNHTGINVVDATTIEMQRLLKRASYLNASMVQKIINACKEMDHQKFSQTPNLTRPTIDAMINTITQIIKAISK
jgi:hypothetical protein